MVYTTSLVQYDYSVVVPVYNCQRSLSLLYERLDAVFRQLKARWEIVFVNDCSRDQSWEVLTQLAKDHANVIAVNLQNNFGQHNALMCGFHHVHGRRVITMDDDLQHPPEEIPKLIAVLAKSSFSVVYGQYKQKNHGTFRDFCSKTVNRFLAKVTGSGYGVTSFRNGVESIKRSSQYYVMVDVLIKDAVHSSLVGHCVVEHHSRTLGKSNYSFRKLATYALNMIFNYTTLPLRMASVLGIFFSMVSFLFAVFFVLYYFVQGVAVSGWTSLILAITFFSGLILFVLGILGEYIGRIFLHESNKPQFVVKEIIEGGKKHAF